MQATAATKPITVYEVLRSGAKPKRRRGKSGVPAKRQMGLSAEKEIEIKGRLLGEVPSAYWAEIQFVQIADTAPDGLLLSYRLHAPQAFPPKADTTPMVECPCCRRKVPAATMETPLPLIVWKRRYRTARSKFKDGWFAVIDTVEDEVLHDGSPTLKAAKAIAKRMNEGRWIISETIEFRGRCADCRGEKVQQSHGASPSAVAIRNAQNCNLRLETIKVASETPSDLRREIRRFEQKGILPRESRDLEEIEFHAGGVHRKIVPKYNK